MAYSSGYTEDLFLPVQVMIIQIEIITHLGSNKGRRVHVRYRFSKKFFYTIAITPKALISGLWVWNTSPCSLLSITGFENPRHLSPDRRVVNFFWPDNWTSPAGGVLTFLNMPSYPTGPFTNFQASKSGDGWILCSSETACDGFWSSKVMKGSIGYMHTFIVVHDNMEYLKHIGILSPLFKRAFKDIGVHSTPISTKNNRMRRKKENRDELPREGLTEHFASWEPANPSIHEFYVAQKLWLTDFKAMKKKNDSSCCHSSLKELPGSKSFGIGNICMCVCLCVRS